MGRPPDALLFAPKDFYLFATTNLNGSYHSQ
jgi:hypothetical protein